MGTRRDAPGPLRLVEAFLRTRGEVADDQGFRRWLAAHDLPATAAVTYDRAVRLREALRSLMLANNGGTADPAAVAVVNAEITACGLRPQLATDAARLR